MKSAKKTILFGGTFNPIHNGHLSLCENALRLLNADHCLLIPSFVPPHKPDTGLVDASHRLAMCRLAIADKPCFSICELELRRGGLSYTIDTVRALKQQTGGELINLCGADMFITLPQWRQYTELLSLTAFAGAPRNGICIDEMNQIAEKIRADGGIATVLDIPLPDISSTMLRNRIKKGESVSAFMPPSVEKYSFENGLYG